MFHTRFMRGRRIVSVVAALAILVGGLLAFGSPASAGPNDTDFVVSVNAPSGPPGYPESAGWTLDNTAGENGSTNVVLEFRLPDGVSLYPDFASVTSLLGNPVDFTWNVSGGVSTITIAEIQAGDSLSGGIELVYTIEPGTYTAEIEVMASDSNDVSSTPGNGDPSENDQASINFTVESPDVTELVLSNHFAKDGVNVTSAFPEETVQYNVNLQNTGTILSEGVVVNSPLPTGFTYVGHTAPAGTTYDPVTGDWDIPVIGGLTSETLVIDVLLDAGTEGQQLCNVAEVTESDYPYVNGTPGNNDPSESDWTQACLNVSENMIDLSVDMSVSENTVTVDDNVSYTITVTNDGDIDATGVTLENILPAGLDFVSSDGEYDVDTGVIAVGTVAAGSSETIVVNAVVTDVGEIVNTVQVLSANESDVDSTPGNNDASEDDQVSITIISEVDDSDATDDETGDNTDDTVDNNDETVDNTDETGNDNGSENVAGENVVGDESVELTTTPEVEGELYGALVVDELPRTGNNHLIPAIGAFLMLLGFALQGAAFKLNRSTTR